MSRNESAEDENSPCAAAGCPAPWSIACPHGHWCGAHITRHMDQDENCRVDMGKALIAFLTGALAPALKLADEIFPIKMSYIESARHTYEHFYLPFKESYEEAGAPYGATDEGLWRWMEEQFEETSH